MSIDSGNHRHSPESNNPSRSSSSSSSYNCVSLTLVLAFVLLVFFILGFFTIYIFRYLVQLLHHAALSRSRNHARIAVGHDNQTSRPSFHGLYPDIIASFPTFCFSSEKDLPPGLNSLECSVCLAEFSEGELLRQLLHGCSHVFHRECIDIWFVDHNTCPVCRLELNSVVKSSLGGTPLLLRNLGEINSRDQQTEHVVLVVEVAGRPPSPENRAAERAAEEGHEDERRTCIMHENGPEVHT